MGTTTSPVHTLHRETIRNALELANRAPSLHNSQPWRWVAWRHAVELYLDRSRMLAHTDPRGRQMILSCGAALHHARVVFRAFGWDCAVESDREPCGDQLATLRLLDRVEPGEYDVALARAIPRRHSSRVPFAASIADQDDLRGLQEAAARFDVDVRLFPADRFADLAAVSAGVTYARDNDSAYQDELRWWTNELPQPYGMPSYALPSRAEHDMLRAGRRFASTESDAQRPPAPDLADLVVLGTDHDSRSSWLRSGQALSAVLLDATSRGLATCPLSHITELSASRSALAELIGTPTLPQVLVRIGVGTDPNPLHPTPRRPVADTVRLLD